MRPVVRRFQRGTALLDLFAVVLIVGILTSIVIPMVFSARDRSNRARCMNNLRQIGLALRHYARDHRGQLPSTRPSGGETAVPEITNAGCDAANPFAADGPGPNNVPAAYFLLVRTQELAPETFVCPNTRGIPDPLAERLPLRRSNFTDLRENLSYSFQNPYADQSALQAGFRWTIDLPETFALAADKNPGIAGSAGQILQITPRSPLEDLRLANSRNHARRGQNVLYADGRVEFQPTPLAGLQRDNIFATRIGRLFDSPRGPEDSILLPPE